MPHHRPIPPLAIDPVTLKDAARGIRFMAERGGRSLYDALTFAPLPGPAARLTDQAFHSLHRVTKAAERSVSAVVHSVLDEDGTRELRFANMDDAENIFAETFYAGMRVSLARLGIEASFVSERTARDAWRTVQAGGCGTDSLVAGHLFLALIAGRALQDALLPAQGDLSLADAARLAVFATLLAMLANPADAPAIVGDCLDLALALRAELAVAEAAEPLARLFEELRDHV